MRSPGDITNEFSIQEYVAKQFAKRLGISYDVLLEYRDKVGKRQDIAILFNRTVVSFIECKRSVRNFIRTPRSKVLLGYLFHDEDVPFYFVADKSECYLFLREQLELKQVSFDEAASIIEKKYESIGAPPTFEEIAFDLKTLARSNHVWTLIRLFVENLKLGDIEIGTDSPTFSFSIDTEDELFLNLLEPLSNKRLCRYTTLNSLFDLLNKRSQNMCNIVCMNDRGEYRYADEYVYGRYPQLGSNDFDELDSCYILSLLDMKQEDDLTMWRLYGNDAKGACIAYEAKKPILNGKDGQFFLANVSYGLQDGTHPKLEFVKDLISKLSRRGWSLRLRRWNIWKHFFKSHHFAVEKEVRLMYYDAPTPRTADKDFMWIKNSDSQIVTKMQLFGFADFPLKIDFARIGPKCQEAELLARQFSIMGKGAFSQNFMVNSSEIQDYR